MLATAMAYGESSLSKTHYHDDSTSLYLQGICYFGSCYDLHWLPIFFVLLCCSIALQEATLAELARYSEARQ